MTHIERHGGLSPQEAEGIAVEALSFVAADQDHLGRFLAFSGLGPNTLRDAATEPGFLAGVLEFLMSDETLLLAFTENARIRPTVIAIAHFRLVGSIDDDV
ncbi:DUF3572 domain-containing protein [Breoghania sp.]|uniref:DUF3572 domain-containing protein n=1 Tax=Breoghania sp. TaxID=2065378 RepID=UPI002AAAFED9|nr:DUF3572 domain-containing protein [Breoghania sp.]